MVTLSTVASDITLSATSGWHFSKFEKTAENAATDGFIYIKSNAGSKASSNFSSEEYRQRFRIKRRDVSPSRNLMVGFLLPAPYVAFNLLPVGHPNPHVEGS